MRTIEDVIREEGIEEGIERGIERGIEKTARNMLANGCTIDFVEKMTGLTKKVIEALKKELLPSSASHIQTA